MLISIKISRNSAFSGSDKSRMLFFLLINVKMPSTANRCNALRRTQYMACTVLSPTFINATQTICFSGVLIAWLTQVTDSAVLGRVVKVVSSNPAQAY